MAKRIGELLVEAGVLTQSQLEQALFAQRKDGRKLGQLLIELGLASEVQLTQTLSRQLAVPWVSLYHVDFSRSLLNLVTREAAEKYCLVPIFVRSVRKQGQTLYVAIEDPTNEAAIDDVSRAASLPVKPMIACPSDIRAAIRVYYLGETAFPPAPTSSTPMVVPAPPAGPPGPPPPPRGLPPTPPELRSVAPRPPSPVPPAAPAAHVPPPSAPATSVPAPPVAAVPPPPPSSAAGTGRSSDPGPPPPPSLRVAPTEPRDSKPPESRSGPTREGSFAPARRRPRMISLTLLDGTSISLPAPGKRPSQVDTEIAADGPGAPARPPTVSDQLTARDLVSALRAVTHGVDASEILGTEPKWEALFAALLSVLLKKGLIADWEFLEEFRKV